MELGRPIYWYVQRIDGGFRAWARPAATCEWEICSKETRPFYKDPNKGWAFDKYCSISIVRFLLPPKKRSTEHILIPMALRSLLSAALLTAPAVLGAVIDHDAVVGFAEAVPDSSEGDLMLAYKPYLKVFNGCVPFPAVDADGNTRYVMSPVSPPPFFLGGGGLERDKKRNPIKEELLLIVSLLPTLQRRALHLRRFQLRLRQQHRPGLHARRHVQRVLRHHVQLVINHSMPSPSSPVIILRLSKK